MKFWQRIALGLALAALSAVLFTLAFPPYDLWPLVFVGLVPMVVAQHRVLPRRLSGLALGVGIGGFFWGYFGGMFAGSVWYMRWLPLIIGLVATLIGSRDRAFHQRTGYRWFVLQGAAVWVGIEMVRGFVPVMGTWGFAAYALYEQPWLIQPVSVFGIYGLSLLVLLVNYALALGVLALFDRPLGPVARNGLISAGLVLAAWVGLSLALFTPHASRHTQHVRVAAKHYSHVVFRAVENRVAVVKSDVAFDSAIVDPYGRIVARAVTPQGEPATLVADVPLGTGDAPAVRLGDWVGWLCLGGMVVLAALDVTTARRVAG